MIEQDELERLAAAVDALRRDIDALKTQRESERKGFFAAIDRIDRNFTNLRASVVTLADHDRKRTEDTITFANAHERLTARVSKLEARMDFLLRCDRTVQ
jgi:hypothetical protein